MSDFINYSRDLMEAAKGFREKALESADDESKQAYLRAALLHAFSFLEAHLNYMAEHFESSPMFTLHELGILLEKEVGYGNGAFALTSKTKFSRLTDRIELLLFKCSPDLIQAKGTWFAQLKDALKVRNALVHPREAHSLTEAQITEAMKTILDAVDTLYRAVFKKRLPYINKGIEGGLALK
ncbi:hypothetical protein HB770_03950 [Rhizobium leguminosarum bv. viciae]|uniref:RiboL-PSP-HEPN domain-containing protein n=1 Tax=Rhizobium leguminosarum bv. viciae TaxID=387 RepID=A0A7G6RHR9_RHILV|nr:hypothetical protein HB770_03950 [Rhizobium leguminosarum bv. viciae]